MHCAAFGKVERKNCIKRLFELCANRNARRLDVAHLPRQQNADKEHNRKTDPKRQSAHHVAAFALAAFAVPILEHEEKRRTQAGEDGNES